MRKSILSVLLTALVLTSGNPVAFGQAPPKEPVIVKIKVSEPMRIKGDVKLLRDSCVAQGTLIGNDTDYSDGYIFKEGSKIVLGTQKLEKGKPSPITFTLPAEKIIPGETQPAIGSVYFVDEKDEKKFVSLLTIGGKTIEPGVYKDLDSSDFAVELQSTKIDNAKTAKDTAQAISKADAALSTAKKLEVEIEDLKKFQTGATNAINALSKTVTEAESKAARAEAQASTATSMAQKAIEEALEAKRLAGAVDGKLSAAMNDFAAAQKALAEAQKVAPPATLPPAPSTTQLYSFPAGTPAETTHGGETYVRQPCGNYKKKVS